MVNLKQKSKIQLKSTMLSKRVTNIIKIREIAKPPQPPRPSGTPPWEGGVGGGNTTFFSPPPNKIPIKMQVYSEQAFIFAVRNLKIII